MAPVTHIVLFEFKPEVTKAQRAELSTEMLGLKEKCLHATTQKPYILRSTGGTDNSIEGLAQGVTHAFVVEFASVEDRQYYVKEDPAHIAFVQKILPFLAKPYIVDFTPDRLAKVQRRNKGASYGGRSQQPQHHGDAPASHVDADSNNDNDKHTPRAMRAYKVFLVVKAGRDTDHCGLFFETAIDRKGTIVQVTGGGRGGMRLQRQTESALDATWDDDRKDHIGWVMEEKFHWVWTVVRSVPPPGKTAAQCRTAREWTDRVVQALQAQGVMENSRESEATVHEEGDEDEEEAETETDVSTEDLEETRRARHVFVPRQGSESEISEEE